MSESKEKANAKETTDKGTKNIQCASCGSTDVDIVFDDLAKCNRCGAKIKIPKNITNNFVVNKTVKNVESNEEIKFVDKIISEKECLKGFYRTLIFNRDTPLDILDCTVSDLHIDYVQFLAIEANYKGSYTASIGYDKNEQYTEEYTEYNSNLNCNVTKTRVRDRIVTNWSPISGNMDCNTVSCARLGDVEEENSLEQNLSIDLPKLIAGGYVKDFNPKDKKIKKVDKPTEDAINKALDFGQKLANHSLELPGDKIQDFVARCKSEILSVKHYFVPVYKFVYKYNGEEFQVESLAYSDENYCGNVPIEKEQLKQKENDLKKEKVENKLKPIGLTFTIILSLLMATSLIMMLVSSFIETAGIYSANVVVNIIVFAITIVLLVIFNRYYGDINADARYEVLKLRKEAYLDKLKKEGYSITDEDAKEADDIIHKIKSEYWWL